MILYRLRNIFLLLAFTIHFGAASPSLINYAILSETKSNATEGMLLRGRHLVTKRDFDNWQISNVDFLPHPGSTSAGQFELTFHHGTGAIGSTVAMEIYSTDDTQATLTDNCFSKGATLRGIISTAGTDQPIHGFDTDLYDPNVYSTTNGFLKTSTFIWAFNPGITHNPDVYRRDGTFDGFVIATISFCVKFILKDSTGVDVNYKEYALVFAHPG